MKVQMDDENVVLQDLTPFLLAIAPFIALSWAFKNLILKLDPGAQFLISYVEFALVAIAAIIAPEIFFADFFIELLLYIQSVWQL